MCVKESKIYELRKNDMNGKEKAWKIEGKTEKRCNMTEMEVKKKKKEKDIG